jgi:arylsulfatase A-like enzyme
MRILRTAALGAFLLHPVALGAQVGQNVLLIVGDDLGLDAVRCYGSSGAPPTPVMDALAATGVRFTRAYVNPACSPTRACISTGRYGFRTGVPTTIGPGDPGLNADETILPVAFQGTAFSTALVGKWNLGARFGLLTPNQFGWPHFAGILDPAVQDYYLWVKVVDGQLVAVNRYATTEMVDDALLWINAQSGPWVLQLAFNAPHAPFHAPPAYLHTQNLAGLDPAVTPRPFFDAMVQALDSEIGRLLASLPASTLANTNIIVVGDNGTDGAIALPPMNPMRVKGSLYDGGSHVPLIVHGPAVLQPGRTSSALVSGVDLMPTILDLCHVPPPASVGVHPLDGVSFVPLLQNSLPSVRDHVYVDMSSSYSGGGYAIRDAVWELLRIQSQLPQHQEMYDYAADPLETTDLLTSPLSGAAAAACSRLSAILDRLRPDGWVEEFGSGCAGASGPPHMRAQTMPTVGSSFFFQVDDMSSAAILPLALLGFSDTSVNGIPLPISLSSLGMPGCSLYVSADGYPHPAPNGWGAFAIPNYAVYDRMVFHLQAFVVEPGANHSGVIASSGLHCIVGM